MFSLLGCTTLFSITVLVMAGMTRYDGYKVYSIYPVTREQVKLLKDVETKYNLDFWTETFLSSRPVDIMVAPSFQGEFEQFLASHQMSFTIKIENVQRNIDHEQERKPTS